MAKHALYVILMCSGKLGQQHILGFRDSLKTRYKILHTALLIQQTVLAKSALSESP